MATAAAVACTISIASILLVATILAVPDLFGFGGGSEGSPARRAYFPCAHGRANAHNSTAHDGKAVVNDSVLDSGSNDSMITAVSLGANVTIRGSTPAVVLRVAMIREHGIPKVVP